MRLVSYGVPASVDDLIARVAAVILVKSFIVPLFARIVLVVSHKISVVPAKAVPGEILIGSLIASRSASIDDHIASIAPKVLIVPTIMALISAVVLIVSLERQMNSAIAIPAEVLIVRLPVFRVKVETLCSDDDRGFSLRSRSLSGGSEGCWCCIYQG
jgi:hypothetical protein